MPQSSRSDPIRRGPSSHSRPAVGPRGPAVVALGGGHGLSATLRALRTLTDDVTAIVGVADDGGSSGRLRHELGVPPPGDLRMALAALCGDDAWGRTWSQVMQHRFGGNGELAGHATGNLLIAALWEETGNIVEGLEWVAALLGANGRVLPVATIPLDIVADVKGIDPTKPDEVVQVTGQVSIESSRGRVISFRVEPVDPPACPQAVLAIIEADAIVLGPGSWYTSVLTHLMVPGVREALAAATADKYLVLNLDGKHLSADGILESTQDFSSASYLWIWKNNFPEVDLDYVLADPAYVDDVEHLRQACESVGAELVLDRIVTTNPIQNWSKSAESPRHSAHLLAAALGTLLSRGTI